jgi:hypothetical protein
MRLMSGWGRPVPLAIPTNECLLVAVAHSRADGPLPASTRHSVACQNVREGSKKRNGGFGVRYASKQTFVHRDSQPQTSVP